MVVELAVDDLLRGLDDGLAESRVEALEVHVGLGCRTLDDAERADLYTRITTVEQVIAQSDTMPIEQLRSAFDALSNASEEFAARRMNKAIGKALAGQSIDSL